MNAQNTSMVPGTKLLSTEAKEIKLSRESCGEVQLSVTASIGSSTLSIKLHNKS